MNQSMSSMYSLLEKGGLVMIPIMGLSVASVACGFERGWFWLRLLRQESRIVDHVLRAAALDLDQARILAEKYQHLPIGRFLSAPLNLHKPTPETFRLALETAGERELAQMGQGDKLLEATIALAPLLGLLGTVTGLMITFFSLNTDNSGGAIDFSGVGRGISQDLVATAASMIVAVIATAIWRVQAALRARQERLFEEVSGELELIYRQIWYEPIFSRDENASKLPFPIELTLRIVSDTGSQQIIRSAIPNGHDGVTIHLPGTAEHPSVEDERSQEER